MKIKTKKRNVYHIRRLLGSSDSTIPAMGCVIKVKSNFDNGDISIVLDVEEDDKPQRRFERLTGVERIHFFLEILPEEQKHKIGLSAADLVAKETQKIADYCRKNLFCLIDKTEIIEDTGFFRLGDPFIVIETTDDDDDNDNNNND